MGNVVKTFGMLLVFLGSNLAIFGFVYRVHNEFVAWSAPAPSTLPPPPSVSAPSLNPVPDAPPLEPNRTTEAPPTETVIESNPAEPLPADETSADSTTDFEKPELISRVEPQYSTEAKTARFQGVVHVSLTIDEKGRPRDITVLDSPGLGLDEKVIEAVEQWRWHPMIKNGAPIAMEATIAITFRLQ